MSNRRRRRYGATIVSQGVLLAPVLTWDADSADASPDFTVTLDATAAVDDVITVQYDTSNLFLSPTELTDTLDAGEVAALTVSITASDLAAGTYYFRAKHTRASPAAASDWSNTETVTISTGSLAPMFLLMAA